MLIKREEYLGEHNGGGKEGRSEDEAHRGKPKARDLRATALTLRPTHCFKIIRK